jgi:hypothetical protein
MSNAFPLEGLRGRVQEELLRGVELAYMENKYKRVVQAIVISHTQ